tara:strand:+ start:1322 stop:1855 length:534 start_codon:yes stop_codon:yes gene_type:complete
MQIFLKNFNGKTFALDVEPTTYVHELKNIISMKTGIPQKVQRLIFSSKQLSNYRTMSDYNILSESTISMVFRLLSGGMIFVKYNNKFYRLPVKLSGNEVSSSTNDILFNLMNNKNDFKINNLICGDCKKKFYLTFKGYNNGMTTLDAYTSLCTYGVIAASIPNKKSTLNLFFKYIKK